MSALLPLLSVVPLLVLILCFLLPARWERAISSVALGGLALECILFLVLLYLWGMQGFAPFAQTGITLYASPHYSFSVDFYFDAIAAVFFGITCLVSLLILAFSKYYMHRDPGFKRFYCTVLFFFIGLVFVLFSGNFETLFVGWEFIGMSSFLLIAYYRDRFLPVKNALKIFTLYRIADAVLVGALWYAHHLFESNIHFSEMSYLAQVHGNQFLVLGLLFLVIALIKSAQFPFSYWLPRAMEGPTTSSAIFYGALSVHMGLFVLLRTYPLWEGSLVLRGIIILFGLLTALVCTSITRVQSSIKTQIAYASITQIGIMFIELALGLHWLVLVHFVSNAFLRTYQLLISPSIVGYLTHDQFYYFVPPPQKIGDSLLGRLRATFYVLGIKEWNMDRVFSHIIWQPFKALGRTLKFLDSFIVQLVVFVAVVLAIVVTHIVPLTEAALLVAATASSLLSLLCFVRAFSTKYSALDSWNQIFLGHLFGILFLSLFSGEGLTHLLVYMSGIVVAFVGGHACLAYLIRSGEDISLEEPHGHIYEYKRLGNVFLLLCLVYMAFPITPSFLGEEILLSGIHLEHTFLIALFGIGYVFLGVSITRLFTKIFFGPHKKTYHEIAYKSA